MKQTHLRIGDGAACGRTSGTPQLVDEIKLTSCSACLRSKHVEPYQVDGRVFYRWAGSHSEECRTRGGKCVCKAVA